MVSYFKSLEFIFIRCSQQFIFNIFKNNSIFIVSKIKIFCQKIAHTWIEAFAEAHFHQNQEFRLYYWVFRSFHARTLLQILGNGKSKCFCGPSRNSITNIYLLLFHLYLLIICRYNCEIEKMVIIEQCANMFHNLAFWNINFRHLNLLEA